jgi:hypothetical protein
MRWFLLALLLTSCTTLTPEAQSFKEKLENVYYPPQYAVFYSATKTDSTETAFDVEFVVRNENFVACESETAEKCSVATLNDGAPYAMRASDWIEKLEGADYSKPVIDGRCYGNIFVDELTTVPCFDERGALTSVTQIGYASRVWVAHYVVDT